MPIALITGASRGLGRAAAHALARRGWSLIVDARRADDLAGAMRGLADVVTVPGDVTDPGHRADLAAAVGRAGGLDVLVNNASRLGPSPQPLLRDYPLDELGRVYDTNVLAPLALIQLLAAPLAAAAGTIVNVSSDAAVEAYPGWGGYGSAKAALDQLTAVLAAEEPSLRCYALDPGDMRTDLHQQAFPGEDISDRPEPETAVPALMRLIDERPPSGRYRASDLAVPAVAP
ncbi:MAG TPA: SDR family oxidoreductase [Streptosporangiaceae bacterium]|nr:SDR family oxidoreductase [Streptosporangiaceae bacterium]HYA51901.1 SDR family oxidoreductase [Streptosporangiaceae bacterium]